MSCNLGTESVIHSFQEYSYGLIKGGSTYRYILNNKRQAEYMAMSQFLTSPEGKDSLFDTTKQGVDRVRQVRI